MPVGCWTVPCGASRRFADLGLMPDPPSWRSFQRALRIPAGELPGALRAESPSRGPLFAVTASASGRHRRGASRSSTSHPGPRGVATRIALRPARLGAGTSDTRATVTSTGIWIGNPDCAGRRRSTSWMSRPFATTGSDVKLPWELSRLPAPARSGPGMVVRFPGPGSRCHRVAAKSLCGCACCEPVSTTGCAPTRGGSASTGAARWTSRFGRSTWLAGVGLMREAPELDDAFLLRWYRSLWVHGQHVRAHLEIGPRRFDLQPLPGQRRRAVRPRLRLARVA